jgi:hypothetical protein
MMLVGAKVIGVTSRLSSSRVKAESASLSWGKRLTGASYLTKFVLYVSLEKLGKLSMETEETDEVLGFFDVTFVVGGLGFMGSTSDFLAQDTRMHGTKVAVRTNFIDIRFKVN